MLTVLNAIAVARLNGINFGGVLTHRLAQDLTETGHPNASMFDDVVKEYLGPEYGDLFVPRGVDASEYPEWDVEYNTTDPNLTAQGAHLPQEGLVYRIRDWGPSSVERDQDLLQELRRAQASRPFQLASGSKHPLVALHIRRADLPRDHGLVTQSPNELYYSIVESIKRILPRIDVHVFSAVESGKAWSTRDFDGFRARGMQVHLDEAPVVEAWSYFAHADIFVMAPSTFSMAAALFNTKCLVGIRGGAGKVGTPVMSMLGRNHSEMRGSPESFREDLADCITRHVWRR